MTGRSAAAVSGERDSAAARLHVPDEPVVRGAQWRTAVLEGVPLAEVAGGRDGVARWLWARWSVLGSQGMDEHRFCDVVTDYRREVWLWLVGDRTWEQCCAGLIGRIARRLGQ